MTRQGNRVEARHTKAANDLDECFELRQTITWTLTIRLRENLRFSTSSGACIPERCMTAPSCSSSNFGCLQTTRCGCAFQWKHPHLFTPKHALYLCFGSRRGSFILSGEEAGSTRTGQTTWVTRPGASIPLHRSNLGPHFKKTGGGFSECLSLSGKSTV